MKSCFDCIHHDVCAVMEMSTEENKESYLSEFGCSDFYDSDFLNINPGQTVYFTYRVGPGYIIKNGTVLKILSDNDGDWFAVRHIISDIIGSYTDQWYRKEDIGESIFLSREDVENYITTQKQTVNNVDCERSEDDEKNDDCSYTAFAYEEAGIVAEDFATFDSREDAITYAKFRNWDEVVDDSTGKVVWRR